MRRHNLSRRFLLRGTGAALALPWLEAMARPLTAKPTVRLAALYMPNGVHPGMWTPAATGRDFDLSPTLAPLEDLKSELLVLTNLWNRGSVGGDGHYVKISGWLTSTTVTKTLGVDVSCNGISVDQLAARHSAAETPFASLELGCSPVTTGVDRNVGYTRVYGSHIAWGGPTQPLAKEINPRNAFERLLRATRPHSAAATDDKLLLDRVLEDARHLRSELGAADQHRIDEYLSVVRSLEERLERTSRRGRSSWKPRVAINPSAEPPAEPKDYAHQVRLMMDIIALAFQTDSTRVATFMFNNEVSNQNFSFLDGVKDGHHSLSHHQKDPEKLHQYQTINRWHVEQYADLLRRLRSMQEGESNVLDQSMILFGSGIRDGDRHDPHNLPILLAGRAGGRIDAGQHLSFAPDTPLANLYVRLLDAFGAPVERFADSTGPLTGI